MLTQASNSSTSSRAFSLRCLNPRIVNRFAYVITQLCARMHAPLSDLLASSVRNLKLPINIFSCVHALNSITITIIIIITITFTITITTSITIKVTIRITFKITITILIRNNSNKNSSSNNHNYRYKLARARKLQPL